MGVDHVQMALVHRHVGRFHNRAAGVVQVRGGVGQLHEVLEVLDGRVAAALIEIVNKRRAVGRDQHRAVTTDGDVARGITRVLHILFGRCGLNNGAAQAGRKPDAGAIDIGPGIFEQLEDLRVIEKVDAYFMEQAIGVVLDKCKALFIEDVDVGNFAFDKRCGCCY